MSYFSRYGSRDSDKLASRLRAMLCPPSTILWLPLALLIAGCGGSGSSSPDPVSTPTPVPESPNGLAERPSFAAFSLPGSSNLPGQGNSDIALAQRYPELRFNTALLTRPVPGANALLVAQQSGIVSTFTDQPDVASSTVVLDLQSQVLNEGEQGLLGVAFDPDFTANRLVYLHYTTASEPRRGRIARFSWPLNSAASNAEAAIDPDSELVILEVEQPFTNHNGGSVEFGADGMLYIALGDGGSGGDPLNNAQNTENLLGAVLRIDVRNATAAEPYRVPADNPWADDPPNRGELWAIGLRNPFRISFDEVTEELWAGDVGQGAREEVDILVAGGNYGWRVREGTLAFDDSESSLPLSAFIEPIIDLNRDEARSVTGGDVYRGNQFPSLNGTYIYGDFATENIWSLRRNGADRPDNSLLGRVPLPAHFGPDNAGELLITSYNAGFFGLSSSPGNTEEPATLLSATGLFADLGALTPGSGFIEYDVVEPHWSDGAQQRRWLAVPSDRTLAFSLDAPWQLPEGSLLLKQLDMPTPDRGLVRLETRLFIRRAEGWEAFTYVWNESQTDATLTTNGTTLNLLVENADGTQAALNYRVPSQGECLSCHTTAAGTTLSTNTRQFNRNFDYRVDNSIITQNQIEALNAINMFSGDVLANNNLEDLPAHTPSQASDGSPLSGETLDLGARSYLDVNCANCHRAGGPTGSTLELRSNQPLADLRAVDITPESGDLGLENARIIAPGSPASSVLLERMKLLSGERMPPVASNRIDDNGVTVISEWIESL